MTRAGRAGASLLALALLTAGCALTSATHIASGTAMSRGPGVGEALPAFAATDLQGTRQTSDRYQGAVLVLHFWATWCPYCRAEIPELTELHRRGVAVVAVSVDEDLRALKRFVAHRRLPYPVIADRDARPSLVDQFGLSGVPVTYVVGRNGRVAACLTGASDIAGAVRRAETASSTP